MPPEKHKTDASNLVAGSSSATLPTASMYILELVRTPHQGMISQKHTGLKPAHHFPLNDYWVSMVQV